MPKVKLTSISCIQTDETDKDEIYLKIEDRKIWPTKSKFYPIDIDEEASIDLQIDIKTGQVSIDLWEYDFIDSNEILGSFDFDVSATGHFSEMMSNLKGESSYVLNYEIS